MKITATALEEYRKAIAEYWRLSEAHERIMPHPVNFRDKPSPWTFEQWNGIRNLVTEPATAKRRELEAQYPGIGEEYEERRYRACEAEEARRIEEHYR